MKTEIHFFGQLTDITQCQSFFAEDVKDTEILQKVLFENFPGLEKSKFMIAVNNKIVRDKTEISSASKIAIMPPFSGG